MSKKQKMFGEETKPVKIPKPKKFKLDVKIKGPKISKMKVKPLKGL